MKIEINYEEATKLIKAINLLIEKENDTEDYTEIQNKLLKIPTMEVEK